MSGHSKQGKHDTSFISYEYGVYQAQAALKIAQRELAMARKYVGGSYMVTQREKRVCVCLDKLWKAQETLHNPPLPEAKYNNMFREGKAYVPKQKKALPKMDQWHDFARDSA